ncbi:hypothetical protein [uncultured Psychrobacter sp.]|uniref:hypothetical protein n=1 Tax=uncultured Psychrobacter sp. TaxID=259303 RepID=UPI002628CD59|nr:hypothetical protein [uncultured Psychrobacter sp.]
MSISQNLLNLDTVTDGKAIKSDGRTVSNPSYDVSDFIKVEPDAKYTISSKQRRGVDTFNSIAYYDSNRRFIKRIPARDRYLKSITITVPKNVHYARLNMNGGPAYKHNRMFVKDGEVLPNQSLESVYPNSDFEGIYPDPNQDTIYYKNNYNTPEEALEDAARRGGANIIFPNGKYEVALKPRVPNIRLFGTGETYFYAKSRSAVLEVREKGNGFQATGIHFRGQTIKHADSNSPLATSIYCMWIWGKDCKFSNFTSEGAIYDSLYIRGDGEMNFEANDFKIGPSNRNCLTIASGFGIKLKNGVVRFKKNVYVYSTNPGRGDREPTYGGLYLADIEPPSPSYQWGDVLYESIEFINASDSSGGRRVIIQDNNRNNRNYFDITIRDCLMIKEGKHNGDAPYISLKSKSKQKVFRGINIEGGTYNNRVIMTSKYEKLLEDCTFKNIKLDTIRAFSWLITLGEDCVASNINTEVGDRITNFKTVSSTNVSVKNVEGNRNSS